MRLLIGVSLDYLRETFLSSFHFGSFIDKAPCPVGFNDAFEAALKIPSVKNVFSEITATQLSLGFHCLNDAMFGYVITQEAEAHLTNSDCPSGVDVVAACLCHDLGKIFWPESFLESKKEKADLSKKELALIYGHPSVGFAAAKKFFNLPRPIAQVIETHHLHPDGSGYPAERLTLIPSLLSQYVTVADHAEAIVCRKIYNGSGSYEQAIKDLETGRGTAFNANAVDAFVTAIADKKFGWVKSYNASKVLASAKPKPRLIALLQSHPNGDLVFNGPNG